MLLPYLSDKKILYIAPRFFGYEQEIAQEMKKQGAIVDMLPDRVFDTPLMTAITKVKRELVLPFADRIYKEKLIEFSRTHYDLIFVINGQTLSDRFLQDLKRSYPSAKFILYLWDSVNNRPSTVRKLKYFDSIFSFDPRNSQKYGLNFRPLFYTSGFGLKKNRNTTYDISFIGTMHSDRYKIIQNLLGQLPDSTKVFLHQFLKAEWVFHYYKITNSDYKNANINHFKFKSLEKKKVQEIFFASKAILDIEHINQTGLTVRTFEALGSEKKLITTNQTIVDYDFFNDENIFVLDRNSVKIHRDFFNKPYIPLSEDLYAKYGLQGWLSDILKVS